MTNLQLILTIAAVALGTMLTRFLPFFLFPEQREVPAVIRYLGKVLPAAMMGLLVVYSLKGATPLQPPYAIPEIVAICAICLLHRWKGNVLLSIGGGTAIYMFLVQVVFA